MGIPATVIIREGFGQIANNAVGSLGLPSEAPLAWLFPGDMLNEGVDVKPYITENIDKIVSGLTTWKPKVTAKGIVAPPKLTVGGKNYSDAEDRMNALFLRNNWGDGLPIVPPTEERVNWILTGTDLPRDAKIGEGIIKPRAGIATAESLAVCLAMAGGRPEYLPVLIAAIEALVLPVFWFDQLQATHCPVLPAIVVNGPMAAQIRLYGGHGCMGPDPNHPAASPIGRAIRLAQIALGGAVAGIGTVGMFGGLRATNIVFAEDELGYPRKGNGSPNNSALAPDWPTIAMEGGYARTDNVVTAMPVAAFTGTLGGSPSELGKLLRHGQNHYHASYPDSWNSPDHFCGAGFNGRKTANELRDNNGYSKADCKKIMWESSKIPWAEASATTVALFKFPEGQAYPITPKPENIVYGVAGGSTGGHGCALFVGHSNYRKTSAKIKLPAKAKWDALLKPAEVDLGPLPPPMIWA